MKARIAVVAAALLWSVAPLLAQSPDKNPPPLYDEVVVHETDLMIPMRDGVKLATDIYRPARNGVPVEEPLPVLLYRTPYDKTRWRSPPQGISQREFFVKHGYVVVVQDTRGRYKSEGLFPYKYHEFDAPDGYDTIEWLANLPYTNGKTGMWGTSYNGLTQVDASKMNPPHLTTIVPNHGSIWNSWEHHIRHQGAYHWAIQLPWALTSGLPGEPRASLHEEFSREEAMDWLRAFPIRKGLSPLAMAPNIEGYIISQSTQGEAKYYRGIGRNWEDYYEQTADIPMLHIGGWWDVLNGGIVQNYVGLSKKNGPVRLLVGPWDHGKNDWTWAGEVEFGPESAVHDFHTYFHLRWFDHFIKGKTTEVEDEADVRVFVMGTGDGHKDGNGRLFHGGYWRDESAWPLPGTRFTNYYFHGDGSLSPAMSGSGPPSTTYSFDPADPVPSIGSAYWISPGPYDQHEREDHFGSKLPYLPLKARPDVVVFQTEPLQEDVEVVGPLVVKLFVSSSALDTDFTAKLVDVYPPSRDYPRGFDMNLADGIFRARFWKSPDEENLLEPGEVYELDIKLFPTANLFKEGHRIRVDIASSNFPKFDVNPNTGEPLGRHRRMIEADNTIHHSSATHPSHIVLPLVPSGRGGER